MDTHHSSTAETGSSISERSQQIIGKEMLISLSLEQIERIERLDQKYRDWVRKGLVVPPKYKPPITPEEEVRTFKIGWV